MKMTTTMKTLVEAMRRTWVWALVVVGGLGDARTGEAETETRAVPLVTAEGFAVPQAGYRFQFPRDHGAHPEFKLEWWYITGHLFAEDGRRFGYQATFFRSAAPEKNGQLYLAHMALLDAKTGKFYHQERLNREGWDAGAATETLDVRNGPWSLRMTDAGTERMELSGGVRAEVGFALTLTPVKPLVIFGENGVSRKGAEPTAASYYLTFSRLKVEGTLTVGTETFRVSGESWMDHEVSSSQLGAGQVGWDWVSVQLNDGREIMFYRLRLKDGSSDPASTLTWIAADGALTKSDFTWEVLETWTSAETGGVYPVRVRLTTTDPASGRRVALTLEPQARAQELTGSLGGIPYWEGACRVLGEDGKEVGRAFMELTGYAKALKLQ
ncbi:carotenoid 1,2-hydratase [Nibricoccus aquaticus]|uniref:Carotenoid 1,2-hydratase n=1 Tax=Nibricoccus aquaticus TaxID=2576891 RepID=A0A290Q2C1_9BACT|nr:lipocalin-like domain-containing protein [Nibricoccus aquaticus]ATC62664.1 carotenoid 1,2-hydratase [Nibricoccus aquaticus]